MADGVVDGPTQAAPISVIGAPPTANQEGEMDALLLGRTKVSSGNTRIQKNVLNRITYVHISGRIFKEMGCVFNYTSFNQFIVTVSLLYARPLFRIDLGRKHFQKQQVSYFN